VEDTALTSTPRLETRLVERRGRDLNPRRTQKPETVFEASENMPICRSFGVRVGLCASARKRDTGSFDSSSPCAPRPLPWVGRRDLSNHSLEPYSNKREREREKNKTRRHPRVHRPPEQPTMRKGVTPRPGTDSAVEAEHCHCRTNGSAGLSPLASACCSSLQHQTGSLQAVSVRCSLLQPFRADS
jgi:hypothetical protein